MVDDILSISEWGTNSIVNAVINLFIETQRTTLSKDKSQKLKVHSEDMKKQPNGIGLSS